MTHATLLLLISHAVSLITGVIVGYLLALRTLTDIDPAHHREAAMSDPTPIGSHRQTERRKAGWIDYVLLVAFLLAAGSGIYATVATNQNGAADDRRAATQAQCFNTYANDLADALDARQKAAEDYQAADAILSKAIVQVLTPGNDENDVRNTLTAAKAKAAAYDAQVAARSKHPYPDPPREVC